MTKLTPKQEKFCLGVVSGLSFKDAYLQAYDAENMADHAVRKEASRLAKRDDITARIRELSIPVQNTYFNAAVSDSERIRGILWDMIQGNDTKDENKLRAMDMLNRMNQAYKDDTQQDDTETTIDSLDTDKLIKLVSSA